MAKGISLHIGINNYGPGYPDQNLDILKNSENDALGMHGLAAHHRFNTKTSPLLGQNATYENVSSLIREAAQYLHPGDSFLLTFAGHGFSGSHEISTDSDKISENWLLSDRPLWDFLLVDMLAEISAGVKVIIVADSCKSGGMVNQSAFPQPGNGANPELTIMANSPKRLSAEELFGQMRREDREKSIESLKTKIQADVVYLAACRELQDAEIEGNYGAFTRCLLQIWDLGRFAGSYLEFHAAIQACLCESHNQDPWIFSYPEALKNMKPIFKI